MSFTFSIVIPTYNRAENLRRCLDSLVSQKFRDFEVIVCDDGSTDNTSEVVTNYQSSLSLTYTYKENWGGPAVPRNRGIGLAKGKWICFLDSDDWYIEDRLSYLNKVLSDEYEVYYHRLVSINNNGEKGRPFCRQIKNRNSGKDLLMNFNGILTSSTCILRKKLIENRLYFSENKEIIGVEDFDYWIKLGFAGFKFKFLNQELGFYSLEGEDSISFKDYRQAKRLEQMYFLHQPLLSNKDKKKSMAALKYQKACIFLNSDEEKGVGLFIEAFKNGSITVKLRCFRRIIKLYL